MFSRSSTLHVIITLKGGDTTAEKLQCDQSVSLDLMALVKMVEQVQQNLAEIMAPIVEYQLTIIESLKEQYPKTFLKFKEIVQELMKMWNEYIKSHLRNVAPNIFNTPFYPVYENASARSVDLVDANHSNSPPKHLSLREQAIENFKSNLIEYRRSKLWILIKQEFPELIRAVIHQLILNWLFS